jgi:hypothetical protein
VNKGIGGSFHTSAHRLGLVDKTRKTDAYAAGEFQNLRYYISLQAVLRKNAPTAA